MVQIPLFIDRTVKSALQDQLADGIRGLIISGALKENMRLPASRALSEQLGISRNTIKIAYLNLVSQGYLCSKGTRGTFVSTLRINAEFENFQKQDSVGHAISDRHPQLASGLGAEIVHKIEQRVSYSYLLRGLDPAIAPDRTLRRLLLKHLPYRSKHSTRTSLPGQILLRQAVANYVSPLRGISTKVDNVIIFGNEYRALDTVANVFAQRNMVAGLENPCDARLLHLLRSRGLRTVLIDLDEDGIIVEGLCSSGVNIVFVSPAHQRPMGITMSLTRRKNLLEWADRTGNHIVEMDTFGEFCYENFAIPTLFSLDKNERVIYVNSFSEWIGAGIELGYLLLPSSMQTQFLEVKDLFDPPASWLDQRVVADFISSDSLFSHLRRVRQTLIQRRDIVSTAISALSGSSSITGQQAGRHLIWNLPSRFPSATALQDLAAQNGISLQTCFDDFCQTSIRTQIFDIERILLIGYSAISEEHAQQGIKKLAQVLKKTMPYRPENDLSLQR